MTGAFRYVTDPRTCERIWHWFPCVGRPEIARVIPACVRAGAIALPLIGAPGAVPIPTRPVLPPAGPFWAGEAGQGAGPFGSPFAPAGALSPFAGGQGGALAGVGESLGGFGGGVGFIGGGVGVGSVPFAGAGQVLRQAEQVPSPLMQQPGPAAGGAVIPMVAVPTVFSPDVPDVPGPQPVPAPDGVWVLLPALVGLALVRRRRH